MTKLQYQHALIGAENKPYNMKLFESFQQNNKVK